MDTAGVFADGPTTAAQWVVVVPVVLPLLGAALLLMLRNSRDFHAGFTLLIIAVTLYADVSLLQTVADAGPVAVTMGRWLPPFGISFTADAMGTLFAAVAAFVTLIAVIYALGERGAGDGKGSFHAVVLVLLAGVDGAFLTGDLFNLYVWFEVMLIASFGLLVTVGGPVQLDATVKYGFLNFLATSIFLLGLGLIYGQLGTLNMADIVRTAPTSNPAVLGSVGGLFLVAFGIKAAAFPVNAWLPASYHAPPAVISALLAGLLTKVGVYALLRTLLALLPATRDFLEPVLVAVTVGTLILGPLGAIAETNLRRALGFILIGGIGAALAGLALGTAEGVAGAIAYVPHAMLTMAGLYFFAGIIEALTGETDTRRMGGLYAATSLTGIGFFGLALAVAGVPPLLGFWPKLMLLEGAIAAANGPGAWTGWIVAGALLLNALLTLIAVTRIWSHVFWRERPAEGSTAKLVFHPLGRQQRWLSLGAAGMLGVTVAVLSLWPGPLIELATGAAVDLLNPGRYIEAVGLGARP